MWWEDREEQKKKVYDIFRELSSELGSAYSKASFQLVLCPE